MDFDGSDEFEPIVKDFKEITLGDIMREIKIIKDNQIKMERMLRQLR